jgi:ParB family chromosome partitioning protein
MEVAMAKKGLGKGLDALLPPVGGSGEQQVTEIDIGKIEPNASQPRKSFDEEGIAQLADSIRSVGIVAPIIVTDEGPFYRIVAGERRWRAARLAGLPRVPCIVRSLDGKQRLEVARIENLQRQDLNPVEEARGYERLMAEHGYTQDALSKAIGKSRPVIANAVRLLKLPPRVLGMLERGELSSGHARAILSVSGDGEREALADWVVLGQRTVRDAEAAVGADGKLSLPAAGPPPAPGGGPSSPPGQPPPPRGARPARGGAPAGFGDWSLTLGSIEESLQRQFDTRVSLKPKGKSGRIVFEYYGAEDLQRLLEKFGLPVS